MIFRIVASLLVVGVLAGLVVLSDTTPSRPSAPAAEDPALKSFRIE